MKSEPSFLGKKTVSEWPRVTIFCRSKVWRRVWHRPCHRRSIHDERVCTASFVVDLDLTGRASTVPVGVVPPGAWERPTFNIHKPEDDEAVPDPDFKAGSSGHQRFSVIVRGDIEGTPFVPKVRDSMRQRVAFSPPFRVREGDDPVVVTLLADVDQCAALLLFL